MALLEKCLLADLLMIAVYFLSQSSNTYLTGLVLGFPALSILSYSFLYRARGAGAVRGATESALAATTVFAVFLAASNSA